MKEKLPYISTESYLRNKKLLKLFSELGDLNKLNIEFERQVLISAQLGSFDNKVDLDYECEVRISDNFISLYLTTRLVIECANLLIPNFSNENSDILKDVELLITYLLFYIHSNSLYSDDEFEIVKICKCTKNDMRLFTPLNIILEDKTFHLYADFSQFTIDKTSIDKFSSDDKQNTFYELPVRLNISMLKKVERKKLDVINIGSVIIIGNVIASESRQIEKISARMQASGIGSSNVSINLSGNPDISCDTRFTFT